MEKSEPSNQRQTPSNCHRNTTHPNSTEQTLTQEKNEWGDYEQNYVSQEPKLKNKAKTEKIDDLLT